ncbi:hypothetical protein SAMN06265182_1209 [Persephonella hydrogeniphila]|uniref:Uncharacterized protein n=1 Tax=Persephonella hydrogeniphila TaxID=198703 RepID=A0A285NFF3_9AQUI|nr:hypothetical protein [Persephonella hydrogeniphila]SNZ08200.1 hypothetical protein SAMN06265182_1209 [Persephonella hydrogeniphila]
MITKNYKEFNLEKFLENLKKTLKEKEYVIISSQEMTEKNFPSIIVLTVAKKDTVFRISVVLDKNGITVTVVGLKDADIEKEIRFIFENLPL